MAEFKKPKTCGFQDCPDTHSLIRGSLCEIYYPYGGLKCRKHFKIWLENDPEVKRLDDEYRKEKDHE
jgi:hypothetical protein